MTAPAPVPAGDVPDGWPRVKRNPLILAGVGVVAVAAAVLIAAAVQTAASGDPLGAGLDAAGALLLGHFVGFGLDLSRHPRRGGPAPFLGVTGTGAAGLAFRYATAPYYWFLALLLLCTLAAFGIAAALAAAGGVVAWVVAAALAAGAVVTGRFILGVLRLAPGRLVLTPDGIYSRGVTVEHFVPWAAVDDVVAADTDQPMIVVKARPADGTRIRRTTGRLVGGYDAESLPFVAVRAYWLRANTVPAYRALDHYLRHPDRRAELASDRSLHRW